MPGLKVRLGRLMAVPAGTVAWLATACLFAGIAGCDDTAPVDPYNGPVTDPTQLYLSLMLDVKTLTLSTAPEYNTWQLTATPRDALGDAMSGLPAPTFHSPADTLTLRVTPGGLVTALKTGTNLPVIADLALSGNIRHADTTFVTVTSVTSPPVLSSVAVDPLPPDSAIRGIAARFNLEKVVKSQTEFGVAFVFHLLVSASNLTSVLTLKPRAVDTAEASIPNLSFWFESLDPTIGFPVAASNRRAATITMLRPGRARLVVRTTAYGVTVADTVVITATRQSFGDVYTRTGTNGATIFLPDQVWLRPNGVVYWFNSLNQDVDVTFDDPTNVVEAQGSPCTTLSDPIMELDPGPHCVAGSFTLRAVGLPDSTLRTLQIRRFPVPGIYNYHSRLTGATGRVVVSDEGLVP